MRKILFVPFYDSHIRVFAPVIERLLGQNGLEPLVLFLERIHSSVLADFLDQYHLPYVKVDLFKPSFKRGQKIDIADLIWFIRHPLRHLATLLFTKNEVRQLFDRLRPALIVTTTEAYYTERFLLEEAKRSGIPSLCLFSVVPDRKAEPSAEEKALAAKSRLQKLVQRKVLSAVVLWLLLYPARRILQGLGLPISDLPLGERVTKVLVWNEEHREILIGKGGSPGRIIVTGSPLHDMIYHKNTYSGQEIIDMVYKMLDIKKTKGIILFTSQPSAKYGVCSFEEQRDLTELIIETCARFNDYMLVIKLHPRESVEDYGYINGSPLRHRVRLVADKDADLYDLICASRLVLNQDSTVGIDALLFDKNVITISILIRNIVDYVEEGASLNVDKEEKLYDTLHKVLNDNNVREELREGRKRYINKHFPAFDGQATDRAMDLLHQLLNEKSSQGVSG